jgi:S1-C subfamily serine protease
MGNEVDYKKARIVRVICKYKIGDSFGTGFFVNQSGKLITCFHVVFGMELRQIRNIPEFQSIIEVTEHAKLKKYYDSKISSIFLEFPNGELVEAELNDFNEKYDVAILKLKQERKVEYFETDTTDTLTYDDAVFFCGYQLASGYTPDKYPFAINTGVVSSFPEVIVAGEKYGHLQINSINLGGNSGAPLFKRSNNKVIGIINGNMNWGSDNIAYVEEVSGSINLIKAPLRTPLSIAFATSLKTIKSESGLEI